jgi:hypothetical integral membrane protein (TIGR02206 family)
MTDGAAFQAYGPSHWAVLALTVAVPVVLVGAARRDGSGRTTTAVLWGLALLLAGNMAALLAIGWHRGENTWVDYLPMHLCDWLGFIAIAALLTRRQGAYELLYFWGLAGTSQGVLTPDLRFDFPHPYFFTFHVGHSGILAAVAFLTFGCGLRPRAGVFWRAWLWLQAYLVAAAATNVLLDENFGYLCRKPENPSLLDHFGPWPWYLLAVEGIALATFFMLELPWRLRRVRESKSASPAEAGRDR